MEQEATRRTITTNDDRQIPFVLTPSGILQAAIIYDLESENIGANLHIFNSEYTSDVQRFSEYYQGDSSLLRVAPAATDQPVPSTSTSTPVMFQREEYEGYKTVLDQLGWKMVLDDAPTMPGVGNLHAEQWLSQLNIGERLTLAVRRLYKNTAKALLHQNPTDAEAQTQYEQALEDYTNTINAYRTLIRESWHLHEDEADEYAENRVWDPGTALHGGVHALYEATTKETHNVYNNTSVFGDDDVPYNYIVDICSGQNSAAKYFLRTHPRCKVLSIDIEHEEVCFSTMPKHLLSRLTHVQMDVKNLTYKVLKDILWKTWGITVEQLSHVHWSPDCSTFSTADKGRNNYRETNGQAKEGTKAEKHDQAFNMVLKTLRDLAHTCEDLCITCENPSTGWMHVQSQVQDTLSKDKGWYVYETDYCRAAHPDYDYYQEWSQKPTHILAHALPRNAKLPKCNTDCDFSFP